MQLGSLFDGIGAFPLSASKYGIKAVWASEIESFPIKVTSLRFPNMKHIGDVTKINGADIEPVDIITFGSPCTRLSVAGRHDGFDITFKCEGSKDNPHDIYKKTIRATDKYQYIYNDTCLICGKEITETNESALFFHAIRIISEMRETTDGQFPRFAVWENVPGAFSSNKGEDFRAVLEEIAEAEIPMPRSGKWANAGMVRTERVDIAWRVLDAQYWGVPQRRKRIFLVADFGGRCASEILFVEQGLRGDIAESRKARQEAAATVGDGIEESNCLTPWDVQSRRIHDVNGKWPSLYGGEGGGHGYVATGIIPFNTGQITSPQNGNNPKPGDPCHTLCSNEHIPAIAIPQHDIAVTSFTSEGDTVRVERITPEGEILTEPSQLTMRDVSRILRAGAGAPKHEADWESLIIESQIAYPDPAHSLLAKANMSFRDDVDTVVAVDCRNLCENEELSGTIQAKENGGYSLNYQNPVRIGYAVRRLTPLECERLQGFPDHWTDIPGASDTARYKALGNSIAVPCLDYIFENMSELLKEGTK